MIRKILNLGITISLMVSLRFFIIEPLKIQVLDGAMATAIVCCAIIFCSIAIPFIIMDKE